MTLTFVVEDEAKPGKRALQIKDYNLQQRDTIAIHLSQASTPKKITNEFFSFRSPQLGARGSK
jgi:hypothetical protein